MDRIHINLLPVEIKEEAKKEKRKTTVIKLSIGVLFLMILITSVLLSLVILQHNNIKKLNNSIDQSKNQVTSLKEKEVLATLLKSRIDNVNTYSAKKYPQADVYNLLASLFPPNVKIVSLTIDKTNKVLIHGETTNTQALDTLFDNFTDPKQHEGKIASTKIDSLNRSASNILRFDLVVLPQI